MDKAKAQLMRAYLEVSMLEFEKHFNIQVEIGSIRFSDTHATIKLEASDKTAEGEVVSKGEQDFKTYAIYYGMKPEGFGKKFTLRGESYTITGFNRSAKKYKILATNDVGVVYKFSPKSITEHNIVKT